MSLKTRALTGVVFGAVMIGGTIAHAYSAAVLFLIVGACCIWEFSGIVNAKEDSPPSWAFARRLLTVLLGLLPALWVGASLMDWYIPLSAHYMLWLPLLFGLFIFELFAKSTRPFEQVGLLLLALVYIGLPTAIVLQICLKQPDWGNMLIMAMQAIVWSSDSFAYLGGSRIGRTPFFVRISPKKTWEGILCGVLGALVLGYVCSLVFTSVGYSLSAWLLIAAVGCVFGILGDLVESLLKRSLGIKDSGTILPGHGGFLDRFDAFIFLVPFVFFTIVYVLGDGRLL